MASTFAAPFTRGAVVMCSAAMAAVGVHRTLTAVRNAPISWPGLAALTIPRRSSTRADPFPAAATEETVVVLVGSSQCGASRDPTLPNAMRQLRTKLMAQATAGARVAFHGVALDDDIRAGLGWLAQVGPFDEVSVGSNWLNTESIRLMHREFVGEAAVPQIVVVRRRIERRGSTRVSVGPDRLVGRWLGVKDIANWAGGAQPMRELLVAVDGAARHWPVGR